MNLATALESTKAWIGLKGLIVDATGILLMAAPLLGGTILIYLFIRKGMADEQEQKMWRDRIKVTIFCTIGAVVGSGLLTVITGYFK